MPAPTFGALAPEYAKLWASMKIEAGREAEFAAVAKKLDGNRARYATVFGITGVPISVIAVIHEREASGSFATHLANGDPLTARTVHVPAGRPTMGNPPFTWEASAIDALRYDGLDKITNWTRERALYCLEAYNGWGYAEMGMPSPYLWGGTTAQVPGKFVEDGVFDPDTTDEQPGCAGMLSALWAIDPTMALVPEPIAPANPWDTPGWQLFADPRLAWVQSRLNQLQPSAPMLVVDGLDGPMTKNAVRAFQRGQGISADGIVGDQTIAKITAALAAQNGE